MDRLGELSAALAGPSRAIVIAQKDVDLRSDSGENRLFVLSVGEGSLAAGGRGAGFGERKVTAVSCFELKGGVWSLLFRVDGAQAGEYEVPYYVSRLPMTLADGSESMGYGVVDPDLVSELSKKSGIVSSA